MTEHQQRRQFRLKRLGMAVFTSVASKGLALCVQIIAVPLALSALGAERFGIYTMLVSILAWIDLGSFGVGPGLTLSIADSRYRNDLARERKLFLSAVAMLAIIAVTVLCLSAFFLASISLNDQLFRKFFGQGAGAYKFDISSCIALITIIFAVQLVCTASERARSAYQQDYRNNISNVAGNVGSFCLLFWAAKHPSITNLAIATFSILALARLYNAVSLILPPNQHLIARPHNVDLNSIATLMRQGTPFWGIQIASIAMHNFSLAVLGILGGATALSNFAVTFKVPQLVMTGVLMFTQPLWPAISDAKVRRDFEWIRRSRRFLIRYVLLYSSTFAAIFWHFGGKIIEIFSRGVIKPNMQMVHIVSIYFIVWTWNHAHTIIFFGLGWLRSASICLLAEAALVLTLEIFFVPKFGAIGLGYALCIAGLLISAWVQPVILMRRRGEISQAVCPGL